MAKDSIDTRALKDSATEFLKQSSFEKAAEVLENLIRSDAQDMQHRLRLGDCYRRLAKTAKAIEQYDIVGRHYAVEDQFIKAIAAFKVILEIEPGNVGAREQLARMNERRLARPGTQRGHAARAAAAEAVEPTRVRTAPNEEPPDYGRELVFDEEAESFSTGKRSRYVVPAAPVGVAPDLLESSGTVVSLPEATPPRTPDAAPPPKVITPPAPEAAVLTAAPPSPRADIDLRPAADPELPRLPTDAILPPASESPLARSIAELLSFDAEEEIELLSRVDEEPIDAPPGQSTEQLIDDAVNAMATSTGKRLPTRVPLFDDLPRDAFVELVNRLSHRRYRSGARILTEGEQGRSFFVIVEGKVRIWKNLADGSELELAVLDEGAFFGEMAVLSGAPRTANVSAETDTELLEVGESVLRELSRSHPRIAQSLKNFYRRRLLDNVMAISPLFRDFETSKRREIVERFRLRQAAPGEILIKEGAPSDGLYVVLHGSMKVAAKDIAVATLNEGDIFGEMSLLTRQSATATVTSLANSILLRLAKDRFLDLVVTHPQILALVSELTEERAVATRAALRRHGISSFV